MGRRIRVKAVADISSRRELREALAETELRAWYAGRRLGESARGLFSLEGLLSSFVPGGGIVRRIIDNFLRR